MSRDSHPLETPDQESIPLTDRIDGDYRLEVEPPSESPRDDRGPFQSPARRILRGLNALRKNNHEKLLRLIDKDIEAFRDVLKNMEFDLNRPIGPKQTTILNIACQRNASIEFIKELIDADADPNGVDYSRGRAPIHIAAENRNPQILNFLLSHDVTDVNIADDNGNTALHYLARYSDSNQVTCCLEVVLEKKIYINTINNDGQTAIHIAANDRMREVVKAILSKPGVDLDLADKKGKTARQAILEKLPELKDLLPQPSNENCESRTLNKLYTSLAKENLSEFSKLLNTVNERELNIVKGRYNVLQAAAYYGQPEALRELLSKNLKFQTTRDGKTILHLIIERSEKPGANVKNYLDCFDVLMEHLHKIDINAQDKMGHTALHLATSTGNAYCTQKLLEHNARSLQTKKYHSPLHLLILASERADETSYVKYRACFDILLKYLKRKDINITDQGGYTALDFAAQIGNVYFVKELIERGAGFIVSAKHETPLHLIIESSQRRLEKVQDFRECFDLVLENIDKIDINGCGAHMNTALHLAVHLGDAFFTQSLVEHGADITSVTTERRTVLHLVIDGSRFGSYRIKDFNECFDLILNHLDELNINALDKNGYTALHLAAMNGQVYFLEQLIERKARFSYTPTGQTALHLIVEGSNKFRLRQKDYYDCFDVVLKELNHSLINAKDVCGNSALHLAVKFGDMKMVRELIQHGENLPLDSMSRAVLEKYLTSCITRDSQNCISFDYKFLVKHKHRHGRQQKQDHWQNQHKHGHIHKLKRQCLGSRHSNETPNCKVLLSMSKNEDLKDLLKHPLCTSFLDLKWEIVRPLFYLNFFIYFCFVVFNSAFLITNHWSENNSETNSFAFNCEQMSADRSVLWVISSLFSAMLVMREVAQFRVAPTEYCTSFENWLELSMIGSNIYVLSNSCAEESTICTWSAITVLLMWIELALLIGRIRQFSSNIEMLKTVSMTLLKSFAVYSSFLLGYALSFYFLFHSYKKELNFFMNPLLSLFKTAVMMTGEYDIGNVPFQAHDTNNFTLPEHPYATLFETHLVSYAVFLTFVFLVVIALYNLLLGLAVSDTEAVRNDAELVAIASRIYLISYVENTIPKYPMCLEVFPCAKLGFFSRLINLTKIINLGELSIYLEDDGRTSVVKCKKDKNLEEDVNDTMSGKSLEEDVPINVYRDAEMFLLKIARASEQDEKEKELKREINEIKTSIEEIKSLLLRIVTHKHNLYDGKLEGHNRTGYGNEKVPYLTENNRI